MLVVSFSSIVSSTAAYTPNLRHCRKLWKKSMLQVVLGRSIYWNYCTCFWLTQEALGEDFKYTRVRVNPNSLVPFMAYITKEENEEGNSDIGMFEVQVCDVGTLQKPLLTRWRHVNNCSKQVIRSFNSWGKIIGYCYTLTSSNQKKKFHTISKNGLQMCKSNKFYTDLVSFCCFNRAHWARHTKVMHRMEYRTRIFGHSAHNITVRFFIMN